MDQVILDFLKNNYFVIVYGITWLISVITYKMYFDSLLKYFPIIISYTFFSELLGSFVVNNKNIQLVFGLENTHYSNIIYNIYHFIFFLYFFYVFWNVISIKKQKEIIKYGSFIFFIINVINFFIQNVFTENFTYAYLFGISLLIYCTIVYFKQVFKSYTLGLLKYSLLFWVSLGLLIFHTTYLPLKILREFNYEYYAPFRQLHLLMIVLMYILFSIGFLTCKRRAFR